MTMDNYATTFISMRGQDGTRSIVDLEKEAQTNGFSGMTDAEINKLIEYRQYTAAQDAQNSATIEALKAHQEEVKNSISESLKKNSDFLEKLVNNVITPKTVTGNEVD